MLGALFLVAIFNILFNRAFFPTYFKFITQIATGTFIGSKFRSEDVKMLKKSYYSWNNYGCIDDNFLVFYFHI